MAITNRKHIRKILNDLEAINRNDVFRYTRGHLSVAQNKVPQIKTFNVAPPILQDAGKQDLGVTQHVTSSEQMEPPGVLPLAMLYRPPGKKTEEKDVTPRVRKSISNDFIGVTKAEQFKKLSEKSQNALKERKAKSMAQMDQIEQKLAQDLEEAKRCIEDDEKNKSMRIYEHGKEAFDSTIQHSSVFGVLLNSIKSEYDAYILHLVRNYDHRADFIRKELVAFSDSSDLKRLRSLENSVSTLEKGIGKIATENYELVAKIKLKQDEYDSIVPPVLDPSTTKCKPLRKISKAERVHTLRKEISAKEEIIRGLFTNIRTSNIPKGQYKTSMATAKDLQAEVNSLAAGCRMLDRKVKTFESELEDLVQHVEMSEKDARILDEVLNESVKQDAYFANDPFELIGKIESGEICLLDLNRLESQIDSEPWRSYIS